jgi:chaperonin GroES
MKFNAVGDRILVQPLPQAEVSPGGIFIPDSAQQPQMYGKVISAGAGKLNKDGSREEPLVKEGDVVLYPLYTGQDIIIDGVPYIVFRENHIIGVVE